MINASRREFLGGVFAASAATATAANLPPPTAPTSDALKVRFLGTGAADWAGRDERGEHRRNASILVNDRILVDLVPSALDMIPEGCHPEVIFYTHSHGDHFNSSAARKVGVKRAYVQRGWYEKAKEKLEGIETIPLDVGVPVVEGGLRFTPVPANHGTWIKEEQTLNFLIESSTRKLLYATDTGGITAVAARICGIDIHAKGDGIDALIMEATMGMGEKMDTDFRMFTHSSVALVERTVKVLTETKRYHPQPGQFVYLTHMARTLHGTQAELDRDLPSPLKAAYDGLEVNFA